MIKILKKIMKNLFKIEKFMLMLKSILIKIYKEEKIKLILNQALIVYNYKLLNKLYKNIQKNKITQNKQIYNKATK